MFATKDSYHINAGQKKLRNIYGRLTKRRSKQSCGTPRLLNVPWALQNLSHASGLLKAIGSVVWSRCGRTIFKRTVPSDLSVHSYSNFLAVGRQVSVPVYRDRYTGIAQNWSLISKILIFLFYEKHWIPIQMISSIASYDAPNKSRHPSPNSYQTYNAAHHRRTRRPCSLRERFCSSQVFRFSFIQGNGKRTSLHHNCKSFVKCHNPKCSS